MIRTEAKHLSNTATEELVNLLAKRVATSTGRPRNGKFTYIIGNNGTGKSRVLASLAERLATARPPRTVACIANSIHDRFKYGNIGQVRYLGARNQTNAVFLSVIDRQLIRLILEAMTQNPSAFSILCTTVNVDLAFRIGTDFEKQVEKLLTGSSRKALTFSELGDYDQLDSLRLIANGPGRFEKITKNEISTLLKYLELGIEAHLDVVLKDQTRLKFGSLSSGEQNRILILAKVLSVMEEGAVFLIDEPELSLHLHWQMGFHSTLMNLLQSLNRFHVVIATHAPIIISEAAKSDPNNPHNLVAILRHNVDDDVKPGNVGPGQPEVKLETLSFAEVASHEQLVLRYFQASPYHSREVSVEIADTVLGVAEGVKKSTDGVEMLQQLKRTEGLSDETLAQIDEAIDLVERDLLKATTKGDAS